MRRIIMAAATLAVTAPALAATQGDVGAHSSGTILITVSVAAQARMLGGAGGPCVALNTATHGFSTDPAATLPRCGEAVPGMGARTRAEGGQSLIVAPE